ncbi:hypothetical protein FSP39_001496 [Pinctada imbricata]|uniref:Uncharacterized protein n=1 Tax=Pinctada imbricata TaxID=66713 RepID=A0AA88YIL4_PINIB|nr:hypothetical protein FSP39_001496 [Pinctada imbricata]
MDKGHLLLLLILPLSLEGLHDHTHELFTHKFADYRKELRPVLNHSDVVNVRVTLSILTINDFDEISGTITLTVMFNSLWQDERFVWDPKKYGGVKSLTLPQDSVWLPEMVLTTAADETVHISTKGNFKVRVENSGAMSWWRIGMIKSACVADITFFPFDVQQCYIVLSPFGYQTQEVYVESTIDKISFDHFTENGLWRVINSSVRIVTLPMAVDEGYTLDDRVCFVNYTLTIKRKPLYVMVSVVTPIFLLALINPGVFIMPIESGERVSFAITALLSFAVFESMVGDYQPKASDPMSVLSYFLAIMLLNSTMIAISTILTLSMYHKDDSQPLPKPLQKMMSCLQKKDNIVFPAEPVLNKPTQKTHAPRVKYFKAEITPGSDSWQKATQLCDKVLLWYFLSFSVVLCLVFVGFILNGGLNDTT